MIQPRVGATWAYNGRDTIYGSYAKYNPAASSLPRAASWDRNLDRRVHRRPLRRQRRAVRHRSRWARRPASCSSPDMTPRRIDEYLVGTARQFNSRLTGRAYWRYREGSHFWEDTNNNARELFNPPAGIPRDAVHSQPRAAARRRSAPAASAAATSSPSSTAPTPSTTRSASKPSTAPAAPSCAGRTPGATTTATSTRTARRSPTTPTSSSARRTSPTAPAVSCGTSATATCAATGRTCSRSTATTSLNWNATAGAYLVAQSGQPWESWSYEPYISLTTSTSDTARFAEPAGSRRDRRTLAARSELHAERPARGPINLQLAADLFNVNNRQTGYNFQPSVHDSTFNHAARLLRPAALPARGAVQVLDASIVPVVRQIQMAVVPDCTRARLGAWPQDLPVSS